MQVVELPGGTVTFLFTDIEGSTRLLRQLGERYVEVLDDHRQILRMAFARHEGREVDTQGDSFLAVFSRATEAVDAALDAQRGLARHSWPEGIQLRVRMGLHSGEPLRSADGYVGLDLHLAARICAAGHGGQVLVSEAVRPFVAQRLPEGVELRDLGEHRLKDLQYPERIFQLVLTDLPSDFPPLRTLERRPHNLPLQLSSFVGRERELAEIKTVIGRSRLVTLTGTGGAGKTRLALQVAAEVIEDYPDGVWFVDLAPLGDEALVPRAVLGVFGVAEQPDQGPVATLVDRLHDATTLIVLDNCEHLVGACATLAERITRGCRNARVLATSRELLGVPGEVAWRVPSLSAPDPHASPNVTELVGYEAVRLFVERAQLVTPGFRVTDDNSTAIGQLCARLDGIPLAIELAAARVRVLTVEQIVERLTDRFRLLTGGARALRRQQTLQALIDWSHDLLSESERVIFRRLAVFAGGWTLEAAEEVSAGDGITAFEVLDLLTSLVDKSMVVAEAHGGVERYRLLETTRQYAEEKLLRSGEAAVLRDRHRVHFAVLAARGAPELMRQGGPDWIRRLEAEHDNLRAALAWSRGAPEHGLRLAADLAWFWALEAHFSEGIGWLEELLVAAHGPTTARVRALHGLDHLMRTWASEPARARGYAEAALVVARELGDDALVAESLARVGMNEAEVGEYAAARSHLEESQVVLAKMGGDALRTLWHLRDLAIVYIADGEWARARAALEESGAGLQASGSPFGFAMAMSRLALLDRLEGDLVAARQRLEECIPLMVEVHHATGYWMSRAALSNVLRSEGRRDEAQAAMAEQLRSGRRDGNRSEMLHRLVSLGILAIDENDFVRGARLIATHATANGLVSTIHAPDLRVEGPPALRRAREALGELAYRVAWEQGRAMRLDQAVAYALEGTDTPVDYSATG